jgi:hypothetical protein
MDEKRQLTDAEKDAVKSFFRHFVSLAKAKRSVIQASC